MALNIEPLDRNQTTAFREREALRQKVNEIIDIVNPLEITWDTTPTAGHGIGYAVTSGGIKAAIDTEESERIAGDGALNTRINDEETARSNADTDLQAAITSESSARQTADTDIRSQIANEQTARQNADTALGTRIDGKQNALTQGAGITIDNDVISATGIEVVIDTAMSNASTNPVQNKVIKDYVDQKAAKQLTATTINDILTILNNGGYGFLTITFQSPNGNGRVEIQSKISKTAMSVYYIGLQGTLHVFGYITFNDSSFTITYVDIISLTTQYYTVNYSDLTAISLNGVKI